MVSLKLELCMFLDEVKDFPFAMGLVQETKPNDYS